MKHLKQISTILLLAIFSHSAMAQVTSDFEERELAADSYWNGSGDSAKGFTSGNAWFPTVWDTSYGGFWSSGFALSTMKDTINGDYTNMYSAISGSGYNGSATYAVNTTNGYFLLQGDAKGQPVQGAFINNTTNAYMTMLNGNAFSKKFGGDGGFDSDFFRVIFKGYLDGNAKEDSVIFYLADYSTEAPNYIIKDWTWVDFTALGNVDSVAYYFESSDVGDFGINTPLYFCIDNLITAGAAQGIAEHSTQPELNIYPNPSSGILHFTAPYSGNVEVINLQGLVVSRFTIAKGQTTMDISSHASGIYFIRLASEKEARLQRVVLTK